jgi:hypothetical protein
VNLDYIRFDLDDSQVGDVVVSIVHNGFYRKATIWINVDNEGKGQKTPREILIKHYFTFRHPFTSMHSRDLQARRFYSMC